MRDIQFLSKHAIAGAGTTEMRCVQPAGYLRAEGWSVGVNSIYRTMPRATRMLMLHRVPDDAHVARMRQLATWDGCAIAYDTDDLIFEPAGNAYLPNKDGKENPSADYRRAMEKSDVVTVSTAFLKSRVDSFHPHCVVMRNGLSKLFVDIADAGSAPPRDTVNIGYLSGAKGHEPYFRIVEPVLLRLLEDDPRVRVVLAGKLNYSDAFHRFGDRFVFQPFLKYYDFVRLHFQIDVNIVPLIVGDPFAEARSELKFIEAAPFRIPTVASPTGTYAGAIRHGETGMLCEDGEWYDTLARLVDDAALRTRLGNAACADVLDRYGPDAMRRDWGAFMQAHAARHVRPRSSTAARRSAARAGLAVKAGLRNGRLAAGRSKAWVLGDGG